MSTASTPRFQSTPTTVNKSVDAAPKNSVNGKRGVELLRDPALNKSTAFTQAERQALGLVGLVPEVIESEDLQLRRVLQQLGAKTTDLERYIFLTQLHDLDEILFYRTLISDPVRFLPIVYDPTIGEACLKFSHIYRRPHSLYLSIAHKGHVTEVLRNWPVKDVRVICVTDGGRILGLGDQGANGTPIPEGKLQLYTATAGVPPQVLLPVMLDAGTNNERYLSDPLYVGLRKPRPTTKELYEFVDEFVEAVQEVFPSCCIHFEDWTGSDAIYLLARYRNKVCCYNDDIQGTGAVALAGLLAALKVKGGKIGDQRILFLGAGSAGIGLAGLITSAAVQEGLSLTEARARISMFDVNGLLEPSRKDLFDFQIPYSHRHAPTRDLVAAIESIKPAAIIGVSTVGRTFTQEVVEAMSRLNKRPIIFALSNPTEHAECTAEEAYRWSNGAALYAAGVQFPPTSFDGQVFVPSQANNLYVFPAVGMAIYATQPKLVTDEMFIEAAHALADQMLPGQLEQGMLFPPQSNIRETEINVAARVAKVAFDSGLARVPKPADNEAFILSHVYKPEYRNLG